MTKKLIYTLKDGSLDSIDSLTISNRIAVELGLTDENKNYSVKVYQLNRKTYCEIIFNDNDKTGWSNPTDMSVANVAKIKNKIKSMIEFEDVVSE